MSLGWPAGLPCACPARSSFAAGQSVSASGAAPHRGPAQADERTTFECVGRTGPRGAELACNLLFAFPLSVRVSAR